MSIECFPKVLYKGNSVNVNFCIEDKLNSGKYTFEIGDIVRLGIKESLESEKYIIFKEFEIIEQGTDLALILTAEETNNIPTELYAILEIELLYNNGSSINTVYQEEIYLKGVVISA